MRAGVHRLSMAHPGDLSALEALLTAGEVKAPDVVAVIGKTEGNGGVNDFTRGYFTQTLMALLGRHLDTPPEELARRIPCILSGGTEGVLSPHYVVFTRAADDTPPDPAWPALAIGRAVSARVPPQDIGTRSQIGTVAETVRAAMADAAIADPMDVHFVQIKCPCITSARAEAARAAGHTVVTADPNRSMAYARAAGAFGVALALGEATPGDASQEGLLAAFQLFSTRASVSSGVEVDAVEVVLFGNSPTWTGSLRIAHRPMADALDVGAVTQVFSDLGLSAAPQLGPEDGARVRAVFVKCEPDRRGRIRAHRHTMLDDTDINAQRHIRGAVGGLVAAIAGDGRIFVSGGAEHQGPDGGGLIAAIAAAGPVRAQGEAA
ncbi:ring-opening amidohydrolase [Azorhizobium doebereinerae]|uniref:cyanuric acid amidohydrolase n=1 Tax=Azorhizobium doebereinerae TaxID=281091 RepID=UPI000408BCE6|nr:ring-opening amidohydrolase [Azorhizobium doebereinerae]